MEATLIGHGMLIGLAIAAPVGPIGVLCIRRTLSDGRLAGLISGLGAASADLVYGVIAALGIQALSTWLISIEFWMRLGGGLFLCYLGARILLARPASEAAPARGGTLFAAYLGTFILTLTNPLTILAFIAVIAANGTSLSGGGLWLVLGIFLGSAGWWVLISGIIGSIRSFVTPDRLRWINLVSGILIIGFGIAALIG